MRPLIQSESDAPAGRHAPSRRVRRGHNEKESTGMKTISRRGFVGGSLAAAAALKYGHVFAAGNDPDIVDVSGSDPAKMVAAALAAFGGI